MSDFLFKLARLYYQNLTKQAVLFSQKVPFKLSLSLIVLLVAGIQSCDTQKESVIPAQNEVSQIQSVLTVAEAKSWFNGYLKSYQPINQEYVRVTPDWEKAFLNGLSNGQDVIVVPIEHHERVRPANFDTYLWVFRKENNELTHKVIEYLSPEKTEQKTLDFVNFTGAMIVKDWEGNLLNGFSYQKGKLNGVVEKVRGQETSLTKNLRSGKINGSYCQTIEVTRSYCSQFYYKVCVPALGTCTEWKRDELGDFCARYSVMVPQCYWVPDFPGQIAPSSGGTIAASQYKISPGSSAKKVYPNAEWNCFNRNSGATLTIYVDQPAPGTRNPYKRDGTAVDVGHTFIGISQNNVVRSVGFYSNSDFVTPILPSAPGGLYDDSGHLYDVKIDISLTPAQLNAVMNKIGSAPTTYNLNTNNCSNFGVDVAKAAGVNLPATVGNWPGGAGLNPGDLGEDIRLNAPGMVTRSGGNAPQRSANCM